MHVSMGLFLQVAYKSKSLIAAKADHAAAEQARQRLVQRDNEISARIAEMQEDMAAHLVRNPVLPAVRAYGKYLKLLLCSLYSRLTVREREGDGHVDAGPTATYS